MDVQRVIEQARDAMSVQRVYAPPIQQDGLTVIPAARVRGGAGGGTGEGPDGKGTGAGTGFGVSARPEGAFVIQDGRVRWKPALNVNRLLLAATLVTAVTVIALSGIAHDATGGAPARLAARRARRSGRPRRAWGS